MKELIEFTATRYAGRVNDVTLKNVRRELTRLARAVPPYAKIAIEPYSAREGTPAYHRNIVARWSDYV